MLRDAYNLSFRASLALTSFENGLSVPRADSIFGLHFHFDSAHPIAGLAATQVHTIEMPAAFGALGSPTMADEIAFISGIDGSGNVAATSFSTWNGNKPATYAAHSDVGKWGADHATTNDVVTLDYYFQPSANWNATEKGVWESCLALWSAITNIQFNEVAQKSEAEITLKRGNDGSAYEFDSQSDSGGAGDVGGSTLWTKTKATVSIDTSVPGFGPIDGLFKTFGGYVWGTLVHELGHALGLGHGGPYNGNVNPKTQQFSAYDTLQWSTMSYVGPEELAKFDDQYPIDADWNGNTPTTWMALDILAVQGLYGAPLSTPLDGGQVFGFNTNITGALQGFFDFTANKDPVITLWDAGTGNTLDLSGFNGPSTVDLNPGTFSSCAGMINNICIAFDTVIETAIGGKGADNFTGSGAANTLIGNKGGDTFFGGFGADTMFGGPGHDAFTYTDAGEFTGPGCDTVVRFDFAGMDMFDVFTPVSGIDATVNGGSLSNGSFDADMAAALAGNLLAGHAILFTPNAGGHAGETFLIIDANGTAGYQAGQDLVVQLDHAKNLAALNAADFT